MMKLNFFLIIIYVLLFFVTSTIKAHDDKIDPVEDQQSKRGRFQSRPC